ncbi:MAG: hypothetical protein M0006_06875 [Magnetospirillum sp.]|nr:hypothetical protein [Magnetospirillum sp.]
MAAVVLLMAASCAAARIARAGDRHALWAASAMAFGMEWDIGFAALAVVPLLLWDARRLRIYAAATLAAFALLFALHAPGIPHAAPVGFADALTGVLAAHWLLAAGLLGSLAMLVAYFRLRRRGLLERDRLARVLAGIVAGQAATVLLAARWPSPQALDPALMLGGAAAAILWAMSRPILPPAAHRRLWWGVVVVALVLLLMMLLKGTGTG